MDRLITEVTRNNDIEQLIRTLQKGHTAAVAGLTESMTSILACRALEAGRRVLVISANDLKAVRMADDIRQIAPESIACLPGGEIDLTRAAGSLESSWRRLEALYDVMAGKASVLSASVEALMQRMGDPRAFRESVLTVHQGDILPLEPLSGRLVRMGYERVNMVEGKGQFSIRGSILDIYPPALATAVRIEFFDDQVDSLRTFDCISQRSLEKPDSVTIMPATEILVTREEQAAGARRMRLALGGASRDTDVSAGSLLDDLPPLPEDDDDISLFDEKLAPKIREQSYREAAGTEASRRVSRLLADADALEQGVPFRRSRAWLTVLTDRTFTLTDWFAPDLIIVCEPDHARKRAEERAIGFAGDLEAAIARSEAVHEQETLLMDWDTCVSGFSSAAVIATVEMLLGLGGLKPETVLDLKATGIQNYGGQIKPLKNDCASWFDKGYRILLLSGGSARGNRLAASLNELGLPARYAESCDTLPAGEAIILPGTLSAGFVMPDPGVVVVSDANIWGAGYRKSKSKARSGERISTFTDLKVNDYVVHEDYGVGIYQGTVRLQSEGTWRDYLLIKYNGSDKLYVPVEQLERVQRYIGNPEQPPKLNKLGSGEWAKQKSKVKEGLRTLAFDLKKLYAQRSQRNGFAFSPATPWQREFEDEFPYELTPDQVRSVREISEDMESDRSMDRLLCWDVGYGKTEVSLRAAFKAIADNKQVAMLAPTTILVQQHYNTIVKRFRNTGARIEYLSRFRTAKEQKEILARLADGSVDIIVGTHRLLAKDVVFKDLGLLIVDEEQRFGVAHKESIKNMKSRVDVLTLSATPIPRTLHMSMTGIRDMSVLETPPEERIPVQTQVIEYSDAVVRDAILRELSRGGQVYFLYNRVQSIERFYQRLRQLVPEARVGVAHGQMREHALEDVMMDFYAGSYDVLLCTTIIESGLDIPSANTLIVFDADRFGLSQLYQLRGRVGRSSRQAYAYFTVRPDKAVTETAVQRLNAIREFTEFGAGFRIAMRDMEIRGAGNILGPEQHGHLATVGYDMYCKLIEETLEEVGGSVPVRELETRVDLRVDAFLPSDYVEDEKQRMEMYKRIASVTSDDDRADITDELIDRFGDLPPAVESLLEVSELRAVCNRFGVSRICSVRDGIMFQLDENHVPEMKFLLQAMQETDGRLVLHTGKTSGILLRDPKLQERDALAVALKTAKKLVSRLDELTEAAKEGTDEA